MSQTTPIKASAKRKKLDEHSHALVTPPQSPSRQDNIEDLFDENKLDTSMEHHVAKNDSAISASKIQNSQMNTKTYRLIIQIDKIRSKPGPKCKKVPPTFNNDTKEVNSIKSGKRRKFQPLRSSVKEPCKKGSCQLKECIYQSKQAFKCEICDKYYFAMKPQTKSYSCTKCHKIFSNLQSLSLHIRRHFMCDICLTECSSQMTYDKHIRLHVSTDPLHPYKCHHCRKTFELKDNVKQHCLREHAKINLQNTVIQVTSPATIVSKQTEFFCMNCNINFTSDQAYRNHISSHEKNEITCNISEANNIIPVPNPLTGSQIGILQAVKFSCRVCSEVFDNVKDVDLHTRTHLEVPEKDLKCNICKKLFQSSTTFTKHLKFHLKQAHACSICSKAFINKTSLNNHLKMHSEVDQGDKCE